MELPQNASKIAVVIPCYRVREQVLEVIARIGEEVAVIYVVDDCCPEDSGLLVEEKCCDSRVRVLYHPKNQGVGGAMITGYRQALEDGAQVVIKIDGDGQMDPALIGHFVAPILAGTADYTKGNRFFDIGFLAAMPSVRLFGNSVLSLVSKMASGYWDCMDPTNGYTAIHVAALRHLPFDRLDRRYFFESDMLFRLNTVRAVVRDIPMPACYGGEVSNLNIRRVAMEFPAKYINRFLKRIFYTYFLRDFNAGTVEIVFGVLLLALGGSFGGWQWLLSVLREQPATSGTVMLAALPILVGFQLLVSALNYDIAQIPKKSLQHIPGFFSRSNLSSELRKDEADGQNRNLAGDPQRQTVFAATGRLHPAANLYRLEAADQ